MKFPCEIPFHSPSFLLEEQNRAAPVQFAPDHPSWAAVPGQPCCGAEQSPGDAHGIPRESPCSRVVPGCQGWLWDQLWKEFPAEEISAVWDVSVL